MVRTNRLATTSVATAMMTLVLGIGATQVEAEPETTQDDTVATSNGDGDEGSGDSNQDGPAITNVEDGAGSDLQRSNELPLVGAFAVRSASVRNDEDENSSNFAALQRSERRGQRIAFVNVGEIIKHSPGFSEQLDALKEEVVSTEQKLQELRREIDTLRRAADAIENDDSVKSLLNRLVSEKQNEWNRSSSLRQKSLMEREAAAYLAAYELIQREISKYARENDIDIVLQYRSERHGPAATRSAGAKSGNAPVDPTDRSAVLKKINQDIVYIRNETVDITDAIIEWLQVRTGGMNTPFPR